MNDTAHERGARMRNTRSILTVAVLAMLSAGTVAACPASDQTVFACDLVARAQRVEVCERADETGARIETTYIFGNPGDEPELQFTTQTVWGAWNFQGYVEIPGLTGWNLGIVHPNGTVYAVYAYGRYDDGIIRRGILQVYPSIDDFQEARGSLFHAECDPDTVYSDDFAEFFRP